MKYKQVIKLANKFADPFRVTNGAKFSLKDINPADTLWLKAGDKPKAKEALAVGVQTLAALQDKLYAQDKWAVLLIFQAMDAAGKDGAIKHVMSGINPQGCQVFSFKAPSAEDLDHDYLWRCTKSLPNRGHIGIFNRSYYEEVLVVRTHPDLLHRQKLPPELITKGIWKERFKCRFGWFEYVLLASVPARMIVMAFPQNDWGNSVPPVFWGPFRNLFLVILGVGVLYLYLRDSIRAGDRLFGWMGACIFFSFLFYTPVILLARDFPLVGMLMIPKTIMYVVIQILAYRGLWSRPKTVLRAN